MQEEEGRRRHVGPSSPLAPRLGVGLGYGAVHHLLVPSYLNQPADQLTDEGFAFIRACWARSPPASSRPRPSNSAWPAGARPGPRRGAGPGDPLTGAGAASASAGRAPWRRPSPGHQQVGRAGPHIQVHLGPGRHVHVLEQPPEPRPARLPDGDEPGAYRHEPPERFGQQARLDGTRRSPVPFVRARTRTRGDIHLVDRITSTTWISIRPDLARLRAHGRAAAPRHRPTTSTSGTPARADVPFSARVRGAGRPRSSCASTFLLGCTRGGSPGIFG